MKPIILPTGLTLIELLVVIALSAIVLGIAVPSFVSLRERHTLIQTTETLLSHLLIARSAALKSGRTVRLAFVQQTPARWCYGLSIDKLCDCETEADCTVFDQPLSVSAPRAGSITLALPKPRYDLSFSPLNGLTLAGSITLGSRSGYRLKIIRSAAGRIRTCAPGRRFWGYPQC